MSGFRQKLSMSVRTVARVHTSPVHIFVFILGVLMASGLIVWSLNIDLLGYVLLDAPLSLGEKLRFIIDTYVSIFTNFTSVLSVGITVFSILFGLNISLLLYVMRFRKLRDVPKKSGIGATVLAILGGGCIACGTSIITPILATFGATSIALFDQLGAYLIWLGSMLISYSIYGLSKAAAYILAAK